MVKIYFPYVFMCLACITSVQGWSSWTGWSLCSSSCGTGTQYRYRACRSSTCIYIASWASWKPCREYKCRVNGGWSLWLTWGSCSSSCDGGTRYRSRNCNNPVPNYGGSYCIGLPYANSICNTKRCPVNGQWGMWSNWTICETACGEGYQNRSRSCDNPAPDYGGIDCSGLTTDDRQCDPESCAERIMAEDTCCSVGVVTGAVIGSIILTGVVLVLVHFVWRRRGNIEKNDTTSEERRKDNSQHNPSYISSDQKVNVLHQEETDDTGFEQDLYENLKI